MLYKVAKKEGFLGDALYIWQREKVGVELLWYISRK